MPLFLTELVPHDATRSGVTASLDALAAALADAGEIIESQVTSGAERVFVIVESADDRALATIAANGLVPVAEVTVPAPVRLVGTDLAVLNVMLDGAPAQLAARGGHVGADPPPRRVGPARWPGHGHLSGPQGGQDPAL